MGVRGGGKREIIYLSLHCHHQNDSCIKMGSDERAILMFQQEVMEKKSQDSVHKPQPFRRERRAEAVSNRGSSAYQPNALPLGQTGSQHGSRWMLNVLHVRVRCPDVAMGKIQLQQRNSSCGPGDSL